MYIPKNNIDSILLANSNISMLGTLKASINWFQVALLDFLSHNWNILEQHFPASLGKSSCKLFSSLTLSLISSTPKSNQFLEISFLNLCKCLRLGQSVPDKLSSKMITYLTSVPFSFHTSYNDLWIQVILRIWWRCTYVTYILYIVLRQTNLLIWIYY